MHYKVHKECMKHVHAQEMQKKCVKKTCEMQKKCVKNAQGFQTKCKIEGVVC